MPKQFKRANGAGSVYKLSGRRRKSWAACISKGYDKSGKRTREIIGYFETKTEASRALSIYDIAPVSRPNIKLKELYEEWSVIKYPKISKSTADGYKMSYKILSTLHNRKFCDLRTGHYQVVIDEYVDKLSRSYLEKVRALISLLYKYARMNDITTKNYAEFIELPPAVSKDKEIFSELYIKKLFNNDTNHIVKIILIMIYTGFRPGAVLGLTRFDYDSETRILWGGIKTEAGKNRPIPVHPKIQKYIDYFLSLNGNSLICRPDGHAYTLANFRRKHYYPILEKLEIPKLPPHRCRHTFISKLQMAEVQDVSILKLGGHKDFAFISNTYTRLELDKLRKDVERI